MKYAWKLLAEAFAECLRGEFRLASISILGARKIFYLERRNKRGMTPARDWRTGIPVPVDQRWRLTKPEQQYPIACAKAKVVPK